MVVVVGGGGGGGEPLRLQPPGPRPLRRRGESHRLARREDIGVRAARACLRARLCSRRIAPAAPPSPPVPSALRCYFSLFYFYFVVFLYFSLFLLFFFLPFRSAKHFFFRSAASVGRRTARAEEVGREKGAGRRRGSGGCRCEKAGTRLPRPDLGPCTRTTPATSTPPPEAAAAPRDIPRRTPAAQPSR